MRYIILFAFFVFSLEGKSQIVRQQFERVPPEQFLMRGKWVLDKIRPVDSDFTIQPKFKVTIIKFLNNTTGVIEEGDINSPVNGARFNWKFLETQQEDIFISITIIRENSMIRNSDPNGMLITLLKTSKIIIRKLNVDNEEQIRFTPLSEGYSKRHFFFKKQNE